MFSQNDLALSEKDKLSLQEQISISWILSPMLSVSVILVIVIFLAVVFGFISIITGELPTIADLGTKSIVLIGFCSIFFMVGLYQNILTQIDLKSGRKTQYKTDDYKLQEKGNHLYLIINSPKKIKIELLEDSLKDIIYIERPLTIELTRYSKTILFISNDSDNLLEKIENEVYQDGRLAEK